jgi:hypothetical protein
VSGWFLPGIFNGLFGIQSSADIEFPLRENSSHNPNEVTVVIDK